MLPSQITTVATAAGPHVFWLASRAAGIVALILSSVSVGVGLLMSTQKGLGGRLRRSGGAELRVAHEALSLAVLGALAVHGLTLLGDSYLHPSLADVALPFVSSYKTFWTTAGIVAFWALALLGPLLLPARPHRRAALAAASPADRGGLAARPRPLAGRGHRRRATWFLVDDGDRGPAGARAPVRALVGALGRVSAPRRGPLARRGREPPSGGGAAVSPARRQRRAEPRTARMDARELARAKRDALARRARRIRRSVAAATVAMFVAVFLVVYVQLASGHDPALVANAEKRAAAASRTASKRAAAKAAAGRKRTAEREAAQRRAEEAAAGESEAGSGSAAGEGESSGESASSEVPATEEPSSSSESSTEGESSSGSESSSEAEAPSSLTTRQS